MSDQRSDGSRSVRTGTADPELQVGSVGSAPTCIDGLVYVDGSDLSAGIVPINLMPGPK